jgi:hypothetical protein
MLGCNPSIQQTMSGLYRNIMEVKMNMALETAEAGVGEFGTWAQ